MFLTIQDEFSDVLILIHENKAHVGSFSSNLYELKSHNLEVNMWSKPDKEHIVYWTDICTHHTFYILLRELSWILDWASECHQLQCPTQEALKVIWTLDTPQIFIRTPARPSVCSTISHTWAQTVMTLYKIPIDKHIFFNRLWLLRWMVKEVLILPRFDKHGKNDWQWNCRHWYQRLYEQKIHPSFLFDSFYKSLGAKNCWKSSTV